MKISNNFNLSEFLITKTNIKIIPSNQELNNIFLLVKSCLQPLRDLIGRSFIITSGLRTKKLNILIGGLKNSKHLTGLACDFKIKPLVAKDFKLLRDAALMLKSNISFGKLIIYIDEKRYHIEYGDKREVYLKWSNNKNYYDFKKYLEELI